MNAIVSKKKTADSGRNKKGLREAPGKIGSALPDSLMLFTAFMKNAPGLCWVVDRAGYFLYMNPSYMKAFKLSKKQIGKNIAELFPKEIAAEYLRNNETVFSSGRTVHTIEKGVKPNGEEAQFKSVKFLIGNASSLALGGIAMDITKEMVQSDRFASELERFELINRATSEVTWDIDLIKGTRTRGGSVESIFGHKSGIVTAGEILQHIHPEDKRRFEKSFRKVLASKTNLWEELCRARNVEGNYLDVLLKAFVVRDKSGKALRVVGTAKDISKEVMLREKLLSVEKEIKRVMMEDVLKAQERERQELATELHENLAQLLTTTGLMVDVACGNMDRSLMVRSREILNLAVNELRGLQQRLSPNNIALVGLNNVLLNLIENENKKNAGLIIKLQNQLENEILNEAQQLAIFRIAQEAIKNVVQHANASVASIRLRKARNKMFLVVADNGIGCNTETITWGLGWTSIKARAEIINGILEFKARPVAGLTVAVSFPAVSKCIT